MKPFEDFLLTEFQEQHANQRALESTTLQMIQYFFAVEGIFIGGIFSLLSLGTSFSDLLKFAFLVFWFIFLFGHLVYQITVKAMINGLNIDFPSEIIRLYYAYHYKHGEYIYFLANIEDLLKRKPRSWEHLPETSASLAKFTGTVNAANLTVAILLSIYTLLSSVYPQGIVNSMIMANIIPVAAIILVTLILTNKLYFWVGFTRPVRIAEIETLQRRTQVLERIKLSLPPQFSAYEQTADVSSNN